MRYRVVFVLCNNTILHVRKTKNTILDRVVGNRKNYIVHIRIVLNIHGGYVPYRPLRLTRAFTTPGKNGGHNAPPPSKYIYTCMMYLGGCVNLPSPKNRSSTFYTIHRARAVGEYNFLLLYIFIFYITPVSVIYRQ